MIQAAKKVQIGQMAKFIVVFISLGPPSKLDEVNKNVNLIYYGKIPLCSYFFLRAIYFL